MPLMQMLSLNNGLSEERTRVTRPFFTSVTTLQAMSQLAHSVLCVVTPGRKLVRGMLRLPAAEGLIDGDPGTLFHSLLMQFGTLDLPMGPHCDNSDGGGTTNPFSELSSILEL